MDTYAFIDESGTDGMAISPGADTPLYVMAALVVDKADLPCVRGKLGDMRTKYFQGGAEMKSHSIRANHPRRKAVLAAMCGLPFSIYLLVVDKRNLKSPGFRYPKSFVKNIHDRLYKNLLRDFHRLHIRADRIKNPPFMAELRRHFEHAHEDLLFRQWDMEYLDSADDVCIQAADVIAGSVARCFDSRTTESLLAEILGILQPRLVLCQKFPDYRLPAVVSALNVGPSAYDSTIETRAVADAYEFVNEHGVAASPEILARVNCVQVLLTHYNIDSTKWVPARELCSRHFQRFGEEINPVKLRRSVIGHLRDRGLLIASKRAGGYKIATGLVDLTEFVNTQNEKIKKMVARVAGAREKVLRATNRGVDILAPEEFANLRDAIEAMPRGRTVPRSCDPTP